MATVSAEARAARSDATRLRTEAQGLRVTARSNVARSRQRLGRARVEAGKARATRVEPWPSPWSELCWTRSDDTLEQTLVLVS